MDIFQCKLNAMEVSKINFVFYPSWPDTVRSYSRASSQGQGQGWTPTMRRMMPFITMPNIQLK